MAGQYVTDRRYVTWMGYNKKNEDQEFGVSTVYKDNNFKCMYIFM